MKVLHCAGPVNRQHLLAAFALLCCAKELVCLWHFIVFTFVLEKRRLLKKHNPKAEVCEVLCARYHRDEGGQGPCRTKRHPRTYLTFSLMYLWALIVNIYLVIWKRKFCPDSKFSRTCWFVFSCLKTVYVVTLLYVCALNHPPQRAELQLTLAPANAFEHHIISLAADGGAFWRHLGTFGTWKLWFRHDGWSSLQKWLIGSAAVIGWL